MKLPNNYGSVSRLSGNRRRHQLRLLALLYNRCRQTM